MDNHQQKFQNQTHKSSVKSQIDW
jgi:hypothetical protein